MSDEEDKSPSERGETRHGKVPEGQLRQYVQAPKAVVMRFREDLQPRGPAAVRFMGTVGLSLLVEMPPSWRDELFGMVQNAAWVERRDVSSTEVWNKFCELAHIDPRDGEPT